MNLLSHVVLSTVVAGGAFSATSSVPIALAAFIVGAMIDLDHLDRIKGVEPKIRDLLVHPIRTIRDLIGVIYWKRPDRVYIPLHSYELLILLWLIALPLNAIPLAVWISVAFLAHLLADQIAYRPHPLFYFLTFRVLKKFKAEGITGRKGAIPIKTTLLYALIGVYLVMHITVMTGYAPVPDNPEAFGWFNLIQRFLPLFTIGLLIPGIQRPLNHITNIKVGTILCWLAISFCVLTYFINIPERWFAWSTLGLLILLALTIANAQSRLGNVNAWLLGGMVGLLAIGSWEMLYHTGLLIYYDFFGSGTMSYYVTMVMQLTWIIPALIIILVLYQRGLRPRINRITIVCLGISALATIIWFASGMDIPLLFWQGHFIEVNEAARPLIISISRASQSFWLLAVTSCFLSSHHPYRLKSVDIVE